jgi:hypothetical protein
VIPLLTLLPDQERGRVKRDRLELLTALLTAPGFDPLFRADLIELPPRHPIFWWQCEVDDCDCVAKGTRLCTGHMRHWRDAKQRRVTRAEFVRTATPILKNVGLDPGLCRICQHRPAKVRGAGLCERHWFCSSPVCSPSSRLRSRCPVAACRSPRSQATPSNRF